MANLKEKMHPPESSATSASLLNPIPRVAITFCTQCKWNLRAAYFAQELLSTFGNDLGEVSLAPGKSGIFVIEIWFVADGGVEFRRLWDRKVNGGFPGEDSVAALPMLVLEKVRLIFWTETKDLKQRVRDCIAPGRSLGHVDGKSTTAPKTAGEVPGSVNEKTPTAKGGEPIGKKGDSPACQDCA
ncbi:MAG: hypothetical protein M1814_004849 [Vezdaea aestivalis]|nr:MAG: hypothetical protein M1814_004849 [Vezdaea aestivalis]